MFQIGRNRSGVGRDGSVDAGRRGAARGSAGKRGFFPARTTGSAAARRAVEVIGSRRRSGRKWGSHGLAPSRPGLRTPHLRRRSRCRPIEGISMKEEAGARSNFLLNRGSPSATLSSSVDLLLSCIIFGSKHSTRPSPELTNLRGSKFSAIRLFCRTKENAV